MNGGLLTPEEQGQDHDEPCIYELLWAWVRRRWAAVQAWKGKA